MNYFIIFQHPSDSEFVVDSRLIAAELEVIHSDWMQNIIRKYQSQTEQAFGILRFENGEIKGRGQPEKFVWLTEEQALFYTVLSKNTPKVVECKIKIVKSFIFYRQQLRSKGVLQQPHTSVYIQRLENMGDHEIADDVWCAFREGAEVLIMVEKQYKVPVSQMDLCDGSIGTRWKDYRIDKLWAGIVFKYKHNFRDHRYTAYPNAYTYAELPYFKKWLREEYIPKYLPEYLVTKYGKRAVRQIYEEQGLINDYLLELTEEKRKAPKEEEKYEVFLAAREAIVNRYLLK